MEARKIEGDPDVKLSSDAKLASGFTHSSSGLTYDFIKPKTSKHKDILHEFTQEYKRTKGNLDSIKEHAGLLDSEVISVNPRLMG
ncbi:hypothetical protein OPV22_008739 [Ensete ventricosum]|uniref:Uncharacterized protein n=1 Tax=Ensete ventricosum TaxID=4639 RepID=A0AAV8RBT1_ENSVE|nr:hypothetical protein OPV22_008739 [Ensete ventricosum]